MSFIKIEAVKAYQNKNHGWEYHITTPVIINSSHIIDIHRLTFNIHPFSSEAEKEFEKIFDLPVSKLSLFQVNLIDGRNWIFAAPEEKFNNFK